MNVEILQYQQRLDWLFKQVKALSNDAELQSHWARYLCILVSGFLEVSTTAIYAQYARDKAAPYIANYVDHELKSFQNPKMEKIIVLAGKFNPVWADHLKSLTNGELKDAVDSIVANRNLIAHGESVVLTYTRMQSYYARAVKVVELIDAECRN